MKTGNDLYQSFIDKLSIFRTCPICGSAEFSKNRNQLLCPFCFNKLFPPEIGFNSVRLGKGSKAIDCFYLLEWVPDKSWAVSQLIASLKASPSPGICRQVGVRMAKEIFADPTFSGELNFVPAPSATGGNDHASCLAKAIADIFAGNYVNCLRKTQKGTQGATQKSLSSSQRQGIKMESSENFSKTQATILFVDDVVTTGATARSAYNALGRPRSFKVISIAYRKRPSSCGLIEGLL